MRDLLVLVVISVGSSIVGSVIGVLICSKNQGCSLGEKRRLKRWMGKVKEEVTKRHSQEFSAGDALTPVEGVEFERFRRYLNR
jgi:hypothetical protein